MSSEKPKVKFSGLIIGTIIAGGFAYIANDYKIGGAIFAGYILGVVIGLESRR
ncbi:MAG TPA: hypothetical protein PLQ52_02325 [Lacunisphaera sp.]|jgi:hypothetical protein|nr:hypothetical protein [Lacunisphaera sp.]HQY04879.1 hypothetical protein [Lacunisphaera sp.]